MSENEGAQSQEQSAEVQSIPSRGDDARARALAALERMASVEGGDDGEEATEEIDEAGAEDGAEEADASDGDDDKAESAESKDKSEDDEPSTEEWSKLRHRERVYAKQKRELAEMREKVEAERAELTSLRETFAKLRDPSNALEAMEALGISYHDLTAAMLGEDAPKLAESKQDPAIAKLEAELKALREESEASKKAAEEAEKQRRVTSAVNQITGLMSKDDTERWFYLKAQDNHASEVYDYLVAHIGKLQEAGRPVPNRTDSEWVEFAADELEKWLEQDFTRKYGKSLKKQRASKPEDADPKTSDSEPAPSLRSSGDTSALLDRSGDLESRKARALRAAQGLPTD